MSVLKSEKKNLVRRTGVQKVQENKVRSRAVRDVVSLRAEGAVRYDGCFGLFYPFASTHYTNEVVASTGVSFAVGGWCGVTNERPGFGVAQLALVGFWRLSHLEGAIELLRPCSNDVKTTLVQQDAQGVIRDRLNGLALDVTHDVQASFAPALTRVGDDVAKVVASHASEPFDHEGHCGRYLL